MDEEEWLLGQYEAAGGLSTCYPPEQQGLDPCSGSAFQSLLPAEPSMPTIALGGWATYPYPAACPGGDGTVNPHYLTLGTPPAPGADLVLPSLPSSPISMLNPPEVPLSDLMEPDLFNQPSSDLSYPADTPVCGDPAVLLASPTGSYALGL